MGDRASDRIIELQEALAEAQEQRDLLLAECAAGTVPTGPVRIDPDSAEHKHQWVLPAWYEDDGRRVILRIVTKNKSGTLDLACELRHWADFLEELVRSES